MGRSTIELMLSDLIASFTTAISPAHRSLGYLDEMLDMRRRSRVNRQAWQPHLDRTRAFVLSAAARCAKRGRAVILGSGLLLDVPLPELSGLFREVVLQDVACLPEVRNKLKQYRNVSFSERDVTGLSEKLLQNKRRGVLQLPEALPPADSADADLVVSLNILSQLWVVPRAFVGRHLRQIDPGQVDDWCARITETHVAWLRSLPSPVCMIADVEAVKRDAGGGVISRASTVFGLELPERDETWTWNIAPLGKGNRHASKELTVGAWFFTTQGQRTSATGTPRK